MDVRPLLPTDWPDVARIYAEGLASGVATFETDVPSWDLWDAEHLPAPRLVADRGDAVVGWVAVSRVSRRPAYRGVVEHSVYVDQGVRRSGVGRALLDALVAEAPQHGIWTIQTSIIDANEASLRLHEAAGFRIVGRRERIARRDGAWRDTLLLELRLP
jgi:L-amino acid N-acyltransferase YncA